MRAARMHRVFCSAVLLAISVASGQADCKLPETVNFGHPSSQAIIAGFGERKHPLLGSQELHAGVDYAGPIGDPIIAAEGGAVKLAAYSGKSGNLVTIDHSSGYKTQYAHMTSRFAVKVGDCVQAGQVIGFVGNTGLSTGPHLHFEVLKDGIPIDPMTVLPGR